MAKKTPRPAPVDLPLPQLLNDYELAPLIRMSVSFLQRDRRLAKRIPFVKIGDKCLYDPVAVAAALQALAQGGQTPVHGRRPQAS